MVSRSLLALAIVATGVTTGCQSSPSVKRSFQWRADLAPAIYFPLDAGDTWSYDVVDQATGEHLFLVNKVEARDGKRATFFAGSDPLAYEDAGSEIVRLPSGTSILRAPLRVGNEWPISGGKVRITQVQAEVHAFQETFSPCLVTEEVSDDRRVVTWYAPNVGPVKVEIYARSPMGEHLDRVGLLRTFSKSPSTN